MKQSDTESNNPIPYKYIDADNKIYKEPYLNMNNEDSSEEVKKIEKSKSKKNKKNKKKTKDNLSEDDINELIEEKNAEIIELNKKNEKLKNKLTALVKKVNEKITENAEILYKKDPIPTEIQWLTDQYETKKRSLQIEKKMNHSYKVQYNILENKLKNRNNYKESKIDSSNTENETTININRTQSIKSFRTSNKNANVNVSSNLYMSLEDQITKIRNENKDILMKINGIKNKKVLQKKEVDDIISGEYDIQFKQKNDELQKLLSLRAEAITKFNTTERSLDMVKKKIEYFEEKINLNKKKNDNNNNYNDYEYDTRSQYGDNNMSSRNEDFWFNLIKEEINNKKKEEILEIIKSGQSNIINEMKKNKRKIKKKKKSSYDMSTDMTIHIMNKNIDSENKAIDNNSNNDANKKEKNKKTNKNIYSIFSILNNLNNMDNKAYKNENINNENEKLYKLSEDQNLLNDLSDLEYRELVNKKEEYLETNLRLEKNIKNFSKTENSKLSKVAKSIKEKETQLKIIKEKNELIQNEVNNLENIYQLSLEKEKIKQEIEQKLIVNKKDDNENIVIIDNTNTNTISNINKEENDKEIKNNTKNKNNKIKGKNDTNEVNKNCLYGTREEQLLFIKKKYMEENENESNQNNTDNIKNENMTENNEIQDNIITENKELNNNENEKSGDGEKVGDIDYNSLKFEQIPFKI